MIQKIVRFLIFILFSLSATPALPQSDPVSGYTVQHFTDENGLPQNSINDLLFDSNGFLWLATQVGLVRFNGHSFQLYYPDDKPAMESNIQSLGKGPNGTIYFKTTDLNLYCCQNSNNQYLKPLPTNTDTLLYLLNNRKQLVNFSPFLHASVPETPLRQRIYHDLYQRSENFYADDSTHLYLIDHDTLYYYDGHALSALQRLARPHPQLLLTEKKLYLVSGDSVDAVYQEGQHIKGGSLITGDLPPAPHRRPAAPDWFRVFSCGKAHHYMAGQRLYRLYPAADGGLRCVFLLNLDFIRHVSSIEYNSGLDLLLIGTVTEGFYFLRKNRFQENKWPPQLQQQMARHLFGPIALYKDKTILTGQFKFSVDGKYIPIKDSTPHWQRCLYIDKKDRIWGADHPIPRQLTPEMNIVRTFPALDANIVDYTEDTRGRLYCLTQRSVWRLEADTFRRLYTADAAFPRDIFECFSFISPNRLWIGGSSGLTEYDPDDGRTGKVTDMTNTHVRTIYICRDSSVLLGSYGQGFYYYRHKRLYRMPLDRSHFLITAHCFLEDNKGFIWIPGNKGLFKIPKTDLDAWCDSANAGHLYYYYYGRQDGLQTNEFNGGFNPSGIITPDNLVVLRSMKGMVTFYADSLQTDFPKGAINMNRLEVDGQVLGKTDTIGLSAGYNNLQLEIACPYLGNRNNLYLQYNLTGLNEDWNELPEDGIISFNRLKPGHYTLRVRKVTGFGKNNYQYREWIIIVPPLFYRTTGFMILVGLVIAALLFLLIQLRLKLVEKKKEIRAKAEKLKGAVVRLQETVDKLQQSEQQLLKTNRQREKLISLVIHDLRSPLRFLTMLASDLHDNQEQLSAAEIKDRVYWVKKGALDIYNFSEDFLLWITSQKDNFHIQKRIFAMRPLLQEMTEFFKEQVQQRGNRISCSSDEDLLLYSDPHLLITIIRNLTDNANKYTEQGDIRLEARKEKDSIVISVSDTGKGMSPQQIAAFLGQDNLDNVKSGSQLGHKFIYDLTSRLDGTIEISSNEHTGTSIRLHLPASLQA